MPGHSILNRIEWFLVGLPFGGALIWLAYFMVKTEGDTAGLAAYFSGIMGVFIIRQMLLAPPDVSVRKWWFLNCRKVELLELNGTWYYSTALSSFGTWSLYDQGGQHIGWFCTDYDRSTGNWLRSLVPAPDTTPHEPSISWFSRWRSGTLPELQAEVRDASDQVVGYTTFRES